MRHIALLLHIYQPPTQSGEIVRLVDSECYSPLAALLKDTSAHVTLNMNLSLTEQLARISPATLATLAGADGFELCTSGAFHPILPLIPEKEAERQIRLNTEGNRAFLPDKPVRGVFPPEMAWDPRLASLFARLGYGWTVTDDIPWVHSGRDAPFDWIPGMEGVGIFLRSNFWSNRIAFHAEDGRRTAREVDEGLKSWSMHSPDSYLVIALDGETFGHHRKGSVEKFLAPFLEWFAHRKDSRLSTLSEVAGSFPVRTAAVPPGSWSTTVDDLGRGVPWPLWSDPGNHDHRALSALRDEVLRWTETCRGEDVALLRDRMLYSCPFWWASPGRYDAVQVRRGVLCMLEASLAAFRETGDRKKMDTIMTAAGAVPAMCRRG